MIPTGALYRSISAPAVQGSPGFSSRPKAFELKERKGKMQTRRPEGRGNSSRTAKIFLSFILCPGVYDDVNSEGVCAVGEEKKIKTGEEKHVYV